VAKEPKNNSVTGFLPVFVKLLDIIVLFLLKYELLIDIKQCLSNKYQLIRIFWLSIAFSASARIESISVEVCPFPAATGTGGIVATGCT